MRLHRVLCVTLVCVICSGCAIDKALRVESVENHSGPMLPQENVGQFVHHRIVGVRLAIGLGSDDRMYFGLLFSVKSSDRPIEHPVEFLRDATIVGTFRSVREAHKSLAALTNDQPLSSAWYEASYDGNWRIKPATILQKDVLVDEDERGRTIELGEPDAAFGQEAPDMELMPSPLAERGVAVAKMNVKGRGWLRVIPTDRCLSIYQSWDDIEKRIDKRPVRSFLLHMSSGEKMVPRVVGTDR